MFAAGKILDKVLASRLTYNLETAELIKTTKAQGKHCMLIALNIKKAFNSAWYSRYDKLWRMPGEPVGSGENRRIQLNQRGRICSTSPTQLSPLGLLRVSHPPLPSTPRPTWMYCKVHSELVLLGRNYHQGKIWCCFNQGTEIVYGAFHVNLITSMSKIYVV